MRVNLENRAVPTPNERVPKYIVPRRAMVARESRAFVPIVQRLIKGRWNCQCSNIDAFDECLDLCLPKLFQGKVSSLSFFWLKNVLFLTLINLRLILKHLQPFLPLCCEINLLFTPSYSVRFRLHFAFSVVSELFSIFFNHV